MKLMMPFTRKSIRREEEKKNRKGGEKAMHGQFVRDMDNGIDKDGTWEWMRKSDLKVGTKALI